jgi:hypothetical protein
MRSLIVMMSIFGNAPICAFDGYALSCYFFSWQHCENAIRNNPNMRCVMKPNE